VNSKTEKHIETIFRLLDEQHRILNDGPYTSEILKKDREISAQLREICDQLYPMQANEKVHTDSTLKNPIPACKLALPMFIYGTLVLASTAALA
jgi:hypothetical protein